MEADHVHVLQFCEASMRLPGSYAKEIRYFRARLHAEGLELSDIRNLIVRYGTFGTSTTQCKKHD